MQSVVTYAKRLIAVGLMLGLLGAAAPASASPVIEDFDIISTATQAGGHPEITAGFTLGDPGEPEVARDIIVNYPPGIFGNSGAIPKCRAADFAVNQCAPGAQAGLVRIIAQHEGDPEFVFGTVPVYNMTTVGEDETARFAFVVPTLNIPIVVPIEVRSGSDYGLRLKVAGISQQTPLRTATMTVWGFPAAAEHDPERFGIGTPGSPPGCPGLLTTECNDVPYPKAGVVVRPLINNPSLCTAADLPVTMEVVSYQDPGNSAVAHSTYPKTEGCERQKFDPAFELGVTTAETDTPSGLDIRLVADQFLEGTAPSPSTLREATLTLPEGLTINPDAADGQSACPEELAGFGTDAPGRCPDNAKIGTVEVETPALDTPLVGSLYFGEPQPGNQYRVFMIFDGHGVHAKLVASVFPDLQTGQLMMSIKDLPQVPFEEFNLHLFASDRGLVATPIGCTIYRADSVLVPWNGSLAPQRATPSFGLTTGPGGRPCPGEIRPFAPRLRAGTTNPLSGDFSNFILRIDRDDGDQFLGDLNFRFPPGFTGSLRGLTYCPEGAIQAAEQNTGRSEQSIPSCPASSQVGTTNVSAGPGSHPFHAVGRMYLAGPLAGAPLSLAAVTPALAGPYDYGVVVVRVALHLDPQTAQVSALSERVPSIIGGVPIRMRSIQVNIDKPNFTINPTNCSPFTIDSQGIGDQGTITDFSSYFQAVNCDRLPFKPRMTVAHRGKLGSTRRAANTALQFDLRTRPGDANIKSIAVTLSKAFEIDQRHLGNICSEKELVEKQCAGRTAIGKATTTTPLLDQPLSGPVYAVSGSGGLPRLAFILNGQVSLIPRADTKTVKGRLQTTVPVVPDAPIGHFRLNVFGGKTGYLINTRDICQRRPIVKVGYKGQNGKSHTQKVAVKTSCGKSNARGKRPSR